MISLQNVILFSNGHGEDLIGVNLLKAIQEHTPTTQCLAVPLVGKGLHYKNENIPTLFENPRFPSDGFIRTIPDLIKDIQSGIIRHIFSQRKKIKSTISTHEIIFAVGDIYALWMAKVSQKDKQPIIFLPTAKSNRFMPHSWIEKKLMKKWCHYIFTRDNETKEDLVASNLPAIFCGNPMMDNLQATHKVTALNSEHPIIGLLPGSRQEAYENLNFLYKVIKSVRKKTPNLQILIAQSPSLNPKKLNNAFPPDKKSIHTTAFTDVLYQSNFIIGLSGTANEQAIEVGNTVLTFPGFGSQSTLQRFEEQQKLLGKNLHVHPNKEIHELCEWIETFLQNPPPPPSPKKTISASKQIISTLQNIQT